MVKAAVERKDAVEEEVLGAKYKVAKDRCMKVYKKKKSKVKICIYQIKKVLLHTFNINSRPIG